MEQAPSPNHDARHPGQPVSMLVLHYTGMESAAAALARMRDPTAKVSAHYMIDEDGRVFQLVPEERRAWHAGISCWAGVRDINAVSIGIELVNPGHAYPGYAGGYRPFPEAQMTALEGLAAEILRRHAIPRHRVLGHSDVAPARKCDPGELFDWERLARRGIGIMPRAARAAGPALQPGQADAAVRALQRDLGRFGYELAETGIYDAQTLEVVTAFQRHFRRSRVDGLADPETRGALSDLLAQLGA